MVRESGSGRLNFPASGGFKSRAFIYFTFNLHRISKERVLFCFAMMKSLDIIISLIQGNKKNNTPIVSKKINVLEKINCFKDNFFFLLFQCIFIR